jgi:hypothetical protein
VRKIAILQPNYIPWKGVFDLISRVDVFVFYDDVQFTTKDWRSRNRIKTPHGDLWLTVPVLSSGARHQRICDAAIDPRSNWQAKHYKALKANYQKARYFRDYEYVIEELYLAKKWEKIADLNIFATKLIAGAIGVNAEWHKSSDLRQTGSKNGEKAINVCKLLGCDYFINGPAASSFMDGQLFLENGIELDYISYSYPEYEQLHPPFVHEVTVLDVLFNCGPNARALICMGERG